MTDRSIYIEVDASVADIIARIRATEIENIVLVIPRGAVVLQSLINLRLLKSQAEQLSKTITLSLEGGLGENLVREAGLPIAETLSSSRISEPLNLAPEPIAESDEADSPQTSSQSWPLFRRAKFDFNALPEEEEVAEEEIAPVIPGKPPISWPKVSSLFKLPRSPRLKLKFERHHRIALGIILGSLLVLASVAYFVVPRAYVALEVQADPYTKQFSFVVADQDDLQAAGPNFVTGRYVEVIHENNANFQATGEKNLGEKASGKITIVNTTGAIQGLLANTRFQAANGLVFRSATEILVPPAHGSSAGRAIIDAVADDNGAKYNVAVKTHLAIPGLGTAGQDVVYGEVSQPFTGGTDNIVKVVSQDDINNAKDSAAKNVFASSQDELTAKLKKGETIPNGFIQNEVIDALPSVSIGTQQDQFDVRIQSRSWTVALKADQLNSALANAANADAPDGKQITAQTIATAKIDVVQSNFLTHHINLAVSLNGHVGPKLDLASIVDHLANQPLAAARSYIQSLDSVTTGSIELWPSFIHRVPMLRGNIHAKVVYIGE